MFKLALHWQTDRWTDRGTKLTCDHIQLWKYVWVMAVVRSYHCHSNRDMDLATAVCSCLIILHCSLRDNDLTATGVLTLARALQHNKSLEVLKWVVNWLMLWIDLSVLVGSGCLWIRCTRTDFSYMQEGGGWGGWMLDVFYKVEYCNNIQLYVSVLFFFLTRIFLQS